MSGNEFPRQNTARLAQRDATIYVLWGQRRQRRAVGTDRRTLWSDDDAAFFQPLTGGNVENAKTDLEDLALLLVWRVTLPAVRRLG